MVKQVILVAFSATTLALGILFPHVWFFSLLGVLPALWVFLDSDILMPRRIFLGWLFGTVYSLTASFCMFWPTLPLDWVGVPNIWVAALLVCFLWGTLAVIVGSPFVLFAYFLQYSPSRTPSRVIFIASVWTLVQYAQMWCYALATLGSGSVFGPEISSLSLGYALASFSPLLQFASLGGIYALTFIASLLGAILFFTFPRKGTRAQVIWIAGVIGVCAVLTVVDQSYFLAEAFRFREPVDRARVALVSTVFKSAAHTREKQRAMAFEQIELLRQWGKPSPLPEVVIFPEDSGVLAHSNLSAKELAVMAFGTSSVGIVDSAATSSDGKKFVRMTTFGSEGELRNVYDKIFLIAFGEYIPWFYAGFLHALQNETLNEAIRLRSVDNGSVVTVGEVENLRLGSLFCMEIMSPDLYRRMTEKGANVLTNSLSQSWFHGSRIMDRYTMLLAKVRAVENGRYLVIAGNEFRSTVISESGKVIARDRGDGPSVMAADVELFEHKTFFVRFGARVLFMPLVLVISLLLIRKRPYLQSAR